MKYLLTPLTMFLWYLLTYYGFYFAIIGLIFTFSLSWGILIFGYLFLIGVLYAVFISIPNLLRYFILKFYGLSWFTIIAHFIAGVIGLFSIVYSLKSDSLSLYEQFNKTFFLAWMWGESPLKTIFLIIPFFAIVLGILWSMIIFPIQIKIFESKNDAMVTAANDMKNLTLKAEDLVDSSRILIGILAPKLLRSFPELRESKNSEKLNFFGTIAFTYLVNIHLHFEVDNAKRTELELIVQGCLNDFYEDSQKYYHDLHFHIQNRILDEKNRGKRRAYIHYLTCLWILQKIEFVDEIDFPNQKAIEIATMFASLLENETAGYWSS